MDRGPPRGPFNRTDEIFKATSDDVRPYECSALLLARRPNCLCPPRNQWHSPTGISTKTVDQLWFLIVTKFFPRVPYSCFVLVERGSRRYLFDRQNIISITVVREHSIIAVPSTTTSRGQAKPARRSYLLLPLALKGELWTKMGFKPPRYVRGKTSVRVKSQCLGVLERRSAHIALSSNRPRITTA